MTRFSFAHLADLHLDTPFSGLRSENAEVAERLRDASLEAWDRAVDACLEAGVDFVVIAGDVYDSEEAGVRAQLRFRDGLARLSAAGVPSFVVHGNHDPRGGRWPAVPTWPELVTVFGHETVGSAPVTRGGETLAIVHGISYAEQQVTENLALRFRRDPAFAGFQVGVLHANVGARGGHENYAPASLADLRAAGLDYWALGHVHSRAVLSEEAPLAAYPGNLQARHPGETGSKGFLIVEVEEGRPEARFVPLDLVRFETLELDVSGLAGLDEVQAALSGPATPTAGRLTVRRADIHGAGRCHRELERAGEEGLLAYLRDVAQAGVWWDAVRLRTRPERDRAERLRAGDFVSDLLAFSDGERPNAHERVAALIEEVRKHPHLRAVADDLGLHELFEEAEALWDEAETLACDLLEEGGVEA